MDAVVKVTRHSINLTTGEKTERKLEGEELREWIDKNLKTKKKLTKRSTKHDHTGI